MRGSILVMVLVAGCVAADAPTSAPKPSIREVTAPIPGTNAPDLVGPDLCALASELAPDNICSLICEPDAMKAMLAASGMPAGRCYELRCALPDATSVNVGLCLPP